MRRDRGLTLIETVIAIAILTIAVLGLSSASISSSSLSRDAWDQRAAAQDLAASIETIQGTPYDALYSTWAEGATLSVRNPQLLMNETITLNYVYYDASWVEHGPVVNAGDAVVPTTGGKLTPDVVQVRITITWTDNSAVQSGGTLTKRTQRLVGACVVRR